MILHTTLEDGGVIFLHDVKQDLLFTIPWSHFRSYFHAFSIDTLNKVESLLLSKLPVIFDLDKVKVFKFNNPKTDSIAAILKQASHMILEEDPKHAYLEEIRETAAEIRRDDGPV